MSTLGATRVEDERLDLHNVNVDQQAAGAGLCGTADLTSGRICILAFRHPGSCRFVPRPNAGTQRPARAGR